MTLVHGPPASGASNWDDFPDTVLHFYSTPEFVLDLRRSVDPIAQAELIRLGFERSFGILTAYDPMGMSQPADVNAGLAASLQREVAVRQAVHLDLDACSPDRSHCELSVAVALALESVITLAYRYNQLAIFWFDGEAFWIVPVHSSNAMLRLPVST